MALLLGSHVAHPHMFPGCEFLLVRPPTGPWAGVPCASPVPAAAAPARTSPCQGSSSGSPPCGELDAISSKSVPTFFYLRVEGEQGQGMNQEGMCVPHPRLTRVFLELAQCAERFISSLSWWEKPTTIFPCLWEPLHLIILFH